MSLLTGMIKKTTSVPTFVFYPSLTLSSLYSTSDLVIQNTSTTQQPWWRRPQHRIDTRGGIDSNLAQSSQDKVRDTTELIASTTTTTTTSITTRKTTMSKISSSEDSISALAWQEINNSIDNIETTTTNDIYTKTVAATKTGPHIADITSETTMRTTTQKIIPRTEEPGVLQWVTRRSTLSTDHVDTYRGVVTSKTSNNEAVNHRINETQNINQLNVQNGKDVSKDVDQLKNKKESVNNIRSKISNISDVIKKNEHKKTEDVDEIDSDDATTKFQELLAHNTKLVDILQATLALQADLIRRVVRFLFS